MFGYIVILISGLTVLVVLLGLLEFLWGIFLLGRSGKKDSDDNS